MLSAQGYLYTGVQYKACRGFYRFLSVIKIKVGESEHAWLEQTIYVSDIF